MIVGLFMAWLSEHLPIEEAAKRAAARIYLPLLSPVYSSRGQQTVTVITIDDVDLKGFYEHWPLSLDFLGRRVSQLADYSPRAIFLDFVFLDTKLGSELEKLRSAMCNARAKKVPVYVATLGESEFSPAERRLFEVDKNGVRCAIPVDTRIKPDSLDQAQWSYPLSFKSNVTTGTSTSSKSAALTIYCDLAGARCPTEPWEDLALIWATDAAVTNAQIMLAEEPGHSGSTVASAELSSAPQSHRYTATCRSSVPLWEPLPGGAMFAELVLGKKLLPVCPYNQVLPLRTLKPGDETGTGFSPRELDDALRHRVVMVGAAVAAGSDTVISPTHGRLPGVHVHAMALDNLISFQGRYREASEFHWHKPWLSGVNLFVWTTVLFLVAGMSWWRYSRENAGHLAAPQLRAMSPSAGSVATPKRLAICLAMIVVAPFMVLLGSPRGPRDGSSYWRSVGKAIDRAAFYAVLAVIVFVWGYYVLRQGPLVIGEYLGFPLFAHFAHLGDSFAERGYEWLESMRAPHPWRHWSSLKPPDPHATRDDGLPRDPANDRSRKETMTITVVAATNETSSRSD